MASSKEFKQAIREGRLNDAFAIAMSNAPELHITTWVASTDSETKPLKDECLRTHVNLVQGEIVNEIGEELIGDDLYSTLQQFHFQQVTQGHQTISQNLQSLQQMFRLLAVLQQQQKGEAYTPIDTWKINDTKLPPTSTNNLRLENSAANLTAEGDRVMGLEQNSQLETSQEINKTSSLQAPTHLQGGERMTSDSKSVATPFSNDEEDNVVNDLLSLDELNLEVDRRDSIASVESEAKPAVKAEDWGDWLDEDNSEINSEIIDIEDLDLDRTEDWQDEDWGDEGDETEFMSPDNRNKS